MMETLCSYFASRYIPFADTHPLKEPFLTQPDEAMLARMLRLLSQGKSFALSGEPGCGKSMFLGTLARRLDAHRYRCLTLLAGGQKRSALLREICEKLGLSTAGRASLRSRIHNALMQSRDKDGPFTVFLLDEAHAMEAESFLDCTSLIQDAATQTSCAALVFSGHPVLKRILSLDIYAAVQTRLALKFEMAPLTDEEAIRFIAYRLTEAGCKEDLFSPEAASLLALDSKGNRRVLMHLCGNSMDEAMVRKEKTITADLIRSMGKRT